MCSISSYFMNYRIMRLKVEVAWPNSQCKSLLLQGYRDQIPIWLLLFSISTNQLAKTNRSSQRLRKDYKFEQQKKKRNLIDGSIELYGSVEGRKKQISEEKPAGISGMATRKELVGTHNLNKRLMPITVQSGVKKFKT